MNIENRKRLDINKPPEMPLGENRYYECSYLETWKPCYTGERKITVWYSWDNVLFDYKQAKKAGVEKSFVVEEVVGNGKKRQKEVDEIRHRYMKACNFLSFLRSQPEKEKINETNL